MEWSRYYEETDVLPLRAQAPYYAYLLDNLASYIETDSSQPLPVALGGLHPKVTCPQDFTDLCQAVLRAPIVPYIIDQNPQALDSFATDNNSILVEASLESLPPFIPPLALLICDFTVDFMSDDQLDLLNLSLPSRMADQSLFILAHDDPLIPGLSKLQNKLKYGVNVHPRKTKELCRRLSNFKPIYHGLTENGVNISVFAPFNADLPTHYGQPYLLSSQDGNFADWLENNQPMVKSLSSPK